MFVHNINPIFFTVGPISVRYYGLVYFLGFLFLYFYLRHIAKKGYIKNFNADSVDSLVLYLIIGVVLGARIFEFLFYSPQAFLHDPLEFFRVWDGGMSYHGGLAGALVAGWWFSKRHKVNFEKIGDVTIIPALFFLAIGRIANFINGELPGKVTNVSWCVVFPGYEGCRHPYVLYASLKNFIVFGVALFLKKLRLKDGLLLWWSVLLYNALRFFVDFTKDAPTFIGLHMGQFLCIAFTALSVYFILKINKKKASSSKTI